MTRVPVAWAPVEPPRRAEAVLGVGPVSAALASAMLRRPDACERVGAAFSGEALIVLGAPEDLPWADGAHYLGLEGDLLLPTTLSPSVPTDLLGRALRTRVGGAVTDLIAALPGTVFVSPRPTGPPDPAWLRAFVRAERE